MSTILVVEDDAIIGQDLGRSLRRIGHDVSPIASSGEEALRQFEETPTDLVLMDIRLRGTLDGIDTAALLKGRWDVPVVFLTAHSDQSTLERAKRAGPHGYLLKPFDERDLRTTIEVALHKHELELRLINRERWYSATLASIGDAVVATDPNQRITYMNRVAEKLTGWSFEQARGRALEDVMTLVDYDGKPVAQPMQQALREGFAASLSSGTRLVPRVGAPVDVDDTASPVTDERDRVLGGVVVFKDVTERKRLEKRVAHAERLASLGTVAAGTAHEINNPLAVISANLSFVRDGLRKLEPASGSRSSDFAELHDALADAQSASDRVRRIIVDLKQFARQDPTDVELVDLMTNHTEVVKSWGTSTYVEVNEGRLVQVFTNLLANAAQALPAGRHTNLIELATLTDSRGRAVAEVRDNGSGIPQGLLERIFDPFFSTKPVGSGMGLGLSLCHTYISSMKGELTVESELGKGTVFRVALPAAHRVPVPSQSASLVTEPSPALRVLVVDDDEMVRRAVARALSPLRVETARDGQAALDRLLADEHFDVVLCDVLMPGYSGLQLVETLKARAPRWLARLVMLTGGAYSPEANAYLESISLRVVTKPFDAGALRELVIQVAAESQP
jgi:two-component system, cell cycle sensor histidine kinase and response regulator CckA